MRTLSYMFFALLLAGCAVETTQTAAIPGPPDVRITPPAPELAPELAVLSGVWEGSWFGWGSVLPARLTIETIDAETAQVIYAWGDEGGERPFAQAGWVRRRAKVLPGGGLEWESGSWKFVFEIAQDRMSLKGKRLGKWADHITMKKVASKPVGAPAAASPPIPRGTIPTPPNLRMTPPAADVPPDLAAFAGTWEGAWDGILPARLIVERIDAESARVVYAWAEHPQGNFKGGWTRRWAKVLPDGKLQWGSEPRLTFTMAKDRRSIEGEWEKGGVISMVTMKKVGQ